MQTCLLDLHAIPLMLNVKQESCESDLMREPNPGFRVQGRCFNPTPTRSQM